MTGVELAVDLVNLFAGEARGAVPVEQVLRAHRIRRPDVDVAALAALGRWTKRLRTVFEAGDAQERCRVVNALLVDGAGGVFLTMHDSLRPHLHFAPDEDDVIGRVMAVTAGGLAIFTVEAEGARLGVCARRACKLVFADTSRSGRRSYCSTRCGNTDAVKRHRTHERRT